MTLEERVEVLERKLRGEEPVSKLTIVHESDDPDAALFVHQKGPGSGAVFLNESDNPPVVSHSWGNASAFEAVQQDGEDAFSCVGEGDVRARQHIGLNFCSYYDGTLKVERVAEPNKYDVWLDFPAGNVRIGNQLSDKRIRFEVKNNDIRFECNGELIMTVSKAGVKIHKVAP